MRILGKIAFRFLHGAELLAPSAVRLGGRLTRLAAWIEDRRTRLTILSVLAD